jgi:3-hydroxyacyl-CoA dehydrogenase/enoyl-CoA hydratase/3-hydroxybutyryl-CoA epimerase
MVPGPTPFNPMAPYILSSQGIACLNVAPPSAPACLSEPIGLSRLSGCLSQLRNDLRAGTLRGIRIHLTVPDGSDPSFSEKDKSPQHAAELFSFSQKIQATLRELEKIGVPVAVALDGTGWGGGLEWALAGHYRVAREGSEAAFGIPEASIGLMPLGGGAMRLAWLLGLEKAFALLSEGRLFGPEEGIALGLFHALAPDESAILALADQWLLAQPNPQQPWDAGRRIPGGGLESPRIAQWAVGANAAVAKRTRGHYPAVQSLLNTLAEGSLLDFDHATRIESRYAVSVALSPEGRNMAQTLWYDLHRLEVGEQRPPSIGYRTCHQVGIIGAGMMGSGIALAAARSGIRAVLKDLTPELSQRGQQLTLQWLDKQRAERAISPEQAEHVRSLVYPTVCAEDFAGSDLVIEAVNENRALKNAVIQEAETYLPADAVMATNTSTLPITGLAQASGRPENFIGLHFFSPVAKMRLVEIICGQQTVPATLASAFDFVRQIGKTPIVVSDGRGFYTSRVFGTYVMEGIALLLEGQSAAMIENAGLLSGMPTPPLALTDEVSLTLLLDVEKQAQNDLGSGYRPHPALLVLQKMVGELKRTGRSSGAGFYQYPENGSRKSLWPGLEDHFPAQQPLPMADLVDRLLFVQVLETLRCVKEGIIADEAAANVGSVLGWGFAPFTGGTLRFYRNYGEKAFATRCAQLAELYGNRFVFPS